WRRSTSPDHGYQYIPMSARSSGNEGQRPANSDTEWNAWNVEKMPNTVATAAIMRRLTRRGSRSMCQLSAVFLPRSTAGPGRRRRKSADSSHVMRTSPTGWRVLSPPAGNSSQRVCMRVRSPGLLDVESTRKVRLLSVPVIRVSAEDPRIADYRNVPDPQLLASRGIFVAEGRHVVRRLLTA